MRPILTIETSDNLLWGTINTVPGFATYAETLLGLKDSLKRGLELHNQGLEEDGEPTINVELDNIKIVLNNFDYEFINQLTK